MHVQVPWICWKISVDKSLALHCFPLEYPVSLGHVIMLLKKNIRWIVSVSCMFEQLKVLVLDCALQVAQRLGGWPCRGRRVKAQTCIAALQMLLESAENTLKSSTMVASTVLASHLLSACSCSLTIDSAKLRQPAKLARCMPLLKDCAGRTAGHSNYLNQS